MIKYQIKICLLDAYVYLYNKYVCGRWKNIPSKK